MNTQGIWTMAEYVNILGIKSVITKQHLTINEKANNLFDVYFS